MIDLRSCYSTAFVICIYLLVPAGCGSGQADLKNISAKIDSLINVQKINDRTIIINFGYDAITAIKTSEGIVIADAGISTGLTKRYRKVIEDEFHQKNFIYVINTHDHHDHIRGNSVFPESKIIGHENCLREITDQWSNPEKVAENLKKIAEDYDLQLQKSVANSVEWNDLFTQRIRYLYAYSDARNSIPVKRPDLTFSDSLKIKAGDTTFEMMYFGNCHSTSDILIYVPELKIIFVGDLFSRYGRISLNSKLVADKEKWQRAVYWTQLRMNNIDNVIEGHGQVLRLEDLKLFNNNILRKCSVD